MQELIEKLNMELSAVREKAALTPLTIRELIVCACDIATRQSEIARYRAIEMEVQHGE